MPGPTMGAIPRPRDAKPGSSAVWGHLDARRLAVSVSDVERALTAYPPTPRLTPPAGSEGVPRLKASATLCALFDDADGLARVVLTVRSNRLRNHSGEISFPGGRIDPGETAEQAASREAWEETHLPQKDIRFIGRLDGLWTFVSHSFITPTVAVLPAVPVLVANPDEVDEIFSVPLAGLMAPRVYHQELWNIREIEDQTMHFFQLREGVVWGATARMLYSLCAVVTMAVEDGLLGC